MFTEESQLIDSDKIEIRYVRVAHAPLWDKNPKLHDIGAIVESIQNNGFRDPATWDSTLGAIVAGNGRTESLQIMEKQGQEKPRGILADSKGNWYMPVLFGIDSESQEAAIRYAVDHNNLTVMGGDFSALDASKMWDKQGYIAILQALKDADADFPITIDASDMEIIANPADYLKKLGEEGGEEEEVDESVPVSNTPSHDSINETQTNGAVVSILLTNDILAEDITTIIEALVDDHPEWEATVKLKYFKPESEYN